MRPVIVQGVGMTRFGKFLDLTLKDLTLQAVNAALLDAGISKQVIEAAYVGNSVAGVITGQDTIRGQVVLRAAGIGGIPIFNIENACASSSTAFHLAWQGVASGMYDCALVLGVEKMTHTDRNVTFKAFHGGVDVELFKEQLVGAGASRSVFMDLYAKTAREYMDRHGITAQHLAKAAAKNHTNGSLNPHAQYRQTRTWEEVLKDKPVVEPLTRTMCAPVSDGAGAAVLCSEAFFRRNRNSKRPVYIKASATLSTREKEWEDRAGQGVIERASMAAYRQAGFGPEDIDLFEIHDTTAAAELMAYESIGLCEEGGAGKLINEGTTQITGAKPVNASGGLVAKGHPIGATGMGQITELVWHLRGEAGERQVPNRPKAALAQNAGGYLGDENAACTITILTL